MCGSYCHSFRHLTYSYLNRLPELSVSTLALREQSFAGTSISSLQPSSLRLLHPLQYGSYWTLTYVTCLMRLPSTSWNCLYSGKAPATNSESRIANIICRHSISRQEDHAVGCSPRHMSSHLRKRSLQSMTRSARSTCFLRLRPAIITGLTLSSSIHREIIYYLLRTITLIAYGTYGLDDVCRLLKRTIISCWRWPGAVSRSMLKPRTVRRYKERSMS